MPSVNALLHFAPNLPTSGDYFRLSGEQRHTLGAGAVSLLETALQQYLLLLTPGGTAGDGSAAGAVDTSDRSQPGVNKGVHTDSNCCSAGNVRSSGDAATATKAAAVDTNCHHQQEDAVNTAAVRSSSAAVENSCAARHIEAADTDQGSRSAIATAPAAAERSSSAEDECCPVEDAPPAAAGDDSSCRGGATTAASALLDRCWEELNTGHWSDVAPVWRTLYAWTSLLLGVAHLHVYLSSSRDHTDRLKRALYCLDMGLIMGRPPADGLLTSLASRCHRELAGTAPSTDDAGTAQSTDDAGTARSTNDAGTARSTDDAGTAQSTNDAGTARSTIDAGTAPSTNDAGTARSTDDAGTAQSSEDGGRGVGPESVPTCDAAAAAAPALLHPLERLQRPSLERFVCELFGRRAAVLTDCVPHWPALRWTLAHLLRVAGHRTVPVEVGRRYTDAGWTQRLMTLAEFVRQYVTQPAAGAPPGYLAQYELFRQVPELGADVGLPDYCLAGERDDVHTNVWLGPGGTVSPLHHDPQHNCLVQLMGEKYVRVYAPAESDRLYAHETPLLHNTSRLAVEGGEDARRFPASVGARYCETLLRPGQLLYMPPGWWHYVRSLSTSCSVSFWFQ